MINTSSICIGLISSIFNLWILYSTFQRRFSIFLNIVLQLLVVLLAVSSAYIFIFLSEPINEYIKPQIGFILLVGWAFTFKESFLKQAFFSVSLWMASLIFTSLSNFVLYLFLSHEYNPILGIVLYLILRIGFHFIYIYRIKNHIKILLAYLDKIGIFFILLPATAVALHILFFNSYLYPNDKKMLAMFIFSIFIFLIYSILFSNIKTMLEYTELENNRKSIQHLLNLEKRNYFRLDAILKKYRVLNHDFRHHLLALDSLKKSHEYDTMKVHIQKFLKNTTHSPVRRFCEHDLANVVIAEYIEQAEIAGILTALELCIPKNININAYDFCVLLDHALGVALDSCNLIPEESNLYKNRKIIMKTQYLNNRFAFRLEFTSVVSVSGMTEIQSIAQRYNGGFIYEQIDHTSIFSIILMANSINTL